MKEIKLILEDDEKAVAVVGYEGYYVITDLGRVFSLWSGKFLKGSPNRDDGYLHVSLCDDHSKKTKCIHKLVARAFEIPGWDNPDLEVDHINRDKTDNRLINLRMVTPSQNIANRDQELLIESMKLAKRNSTAYNRSKPCICCETGQFFWSQTQAAEAIGHKGGGFNISKCCRNLIQSAYGYHWRYATEEEIAQHK